MSDKPQWPARAADLQQEPAIPKDVEWPPGAEKPAPAIPKGKKADVPANDRVTTSKAEAKEAAPTLAPIADEDAEPAEEPEQPEKQPEKKPAKKAPAKKAASKKPDDAEKRPAPKAAAETRKKS